MGQQLKSYSVKILISAEITIRFCSFLRLSNVFGTQDKMDWQAVETKDNKNIIKLTFGTGPGTVSVFCSIMH